MSKSTYCVMNIAELQSPHGMVTSEPIKLWRADYYNYV